MQTRCERCRSDDGVERAGSFRDCVLCGECVVELQTLIDIYNREKRKVEIGLVEYETVSEMTWDEFSEAERDDLDAYTAIAITQFD